MDVGENDAFGWRCIETENSGAEITSAQRFKNPGRAAAVEICKRAPQTLLPSPSFKMKGKNKLGLK